MPRLYIILLDNLNKAKDVFLIIKPETFEELLNEIKLKINNIYDGYELFILDKKIKKLKSNPQSPIPNPQFNKK